ncbi:sigma-54 interaction domain-containing protein [Cytobacillus depressus]|uniref:sigma-54 interaction domain-containing protein n=1 Tax=Cytobacillus depressus TaxID=1602942 RepID=UPI0014788C17|nr:sigma 54-interacting transcriptional regulator [Cytobacillus depressus]
MNNIDLVSSLIKEDSISSIFHPDSSRLSKDLILFYKKSKETKLLEALLECIPEGVEISDESGKILYVNESFEKITGIKKDSRISKNIYEVNPKSILARTLRERKIINDRLTTAPDINREVVANGSPIFFDNKMIGAIILIKDISQIIHLAKKLNQTTHYLNEMYNRNSEHYKFTDIIGGSSSIQNVIQLAKKVAPMDSTVLIEGENGTGKELFAHSIHESSLRIDKPFFRVNCAAIPEHLLESEFFGHEKGSFTGASNKKVGIFELANGGTLFLDEIGDMPILLQSKLLRVLQEGEIRRVGGSKTIKVDVRIITATNRNLKEMVSKGRFREDLYYRINVITIRIPSLKERVEDILELTDFFIRKYNKKFRKMILGIEPKAFEKLSEHSWPGNVRELENVIEYAVLTSDTEILGLEHFAAKIPAKNIANNRTGIIPLVEMERLHIHKALKLYGNTLKGKKQAAQALGISLATLYNKLKNNGIG